MTTMNVVALNPTVSEQLERTLAQLPEFAPTGNGWLGVMAARRARSGARRRRAGALLAVAAAAVVALAIALPLRLAPPAVDAGATIAAEVQRSRQLEADLANARTAGGNPMLIAVEADLARVDGALQAAYDRGASPAELEPLWRARTAALETLLAGYRHPDTLIRI
ncbi:MAG TPA: hypothetical protein VFL14_06735 [Xanthomonadales bacterium]|nr:hypothetical protein [Xanthomonadales bacterium]